MTVVVLLPGADGTGALFQPLIEALDFECLCVTYPADRLLGYTALTDIALESLPRSEAFIVLGESFSGPIAINIAASKPTGLLGLILCASFARSPRPALSLSTGLLHLLPIRLPVSILSALLMGKQSTRQLRQQLREALNLVRASVMRRRIRAVLKVDCIDRLRRVVVPALYLRATADRLVPRSAGDEFIANAPAGELIEIDAPHFLLQCQPVVAAAAITGFVENLDLNG